MTTQVSTEMVQEKSLVLYDPATKKYFTGFTGDAKSKWTKDVLKADKFPIESEHHFQLKMEMRLLKPTHSNVQVKVFEFGVSNNVYDVGSIENFNK